MAQARRPGGWIPLALLVSGAIALPFLRTRPAEPPATAPAPTVRPAARPSPRSPPPTSSPGHPPPADRAPSLPPGVAPSDASAFTDAARTLRSCLPDTAGACSDAGCVLVSLKLPTDPFGIARDHLRARRYLLQEAVASSGVVARLDLPCTAAADAVQAMLRRVNYAGFLETNPGREGPGAVCKLAMASNDHWLDPQMTSRLVREAPGLCDQLLGSLGGAPTAFRERAADTLAPLQGFPVPIAARDLSPGTTLALEDIATAVASLPQPWWQAPGDLVGRRVVAAVSRGWSLTDANTRVTAVP